MTSIFRELGEREANDVRLPACESYFLMLYLEDAEHADIRSDGSCTPVRRFGRGTVCLVDLADGAAIRLNSRLRSLAFVLPKTLLGETAELSPDTEQRRLVCRRGEPDSVIHNLGTALLAFFSGNGKAPSPAPLRPVAVAICAHLLHRYGEPIETSGGEAPGGDPREDFGAALLPMATRIDRAKAYLANHALSLEDIAYVCGFGDLEHFERAFAGETGVTPSAWWRASLH
ncbi:helix-turn-helix domain-containing protein [Ensifer sp. 4252]|uniref:helix-turn-helix domain-containing protein n=1 Tax=Ensifer sp. 4252 TaxID=3373915 RepID=UPI003D1922A9